ncbi:MAG: alpha-L-arabinofuranosidase, partial [Phaeodactylibacter sp.]|nr:alpha-L-arabinofuranosidase [Phaeodactylibacter sp.]
MKPIWNTIAWMVVVVCITPALSLAQSSRQLEVDVTQSKAKIQPTMYGIFFEDINFAADGGLYAELVKNRSFEFTMPKMGWSQPKSDRHSLNLQSGMGTIIKSEDDPANRNFLRVQVNKASGYELINEGFRGMGIKANNSYDLSFKAAQKEGNITLTRFQLISDGGKVIGETTVKPMGKEWKSYTSVIKATATDAHAELKLTFEGEGAIDLDMISLFPQDTWKGRKKGLRKDLVQLLYDLKPGFLRFPGGCIVEGRTLARRYQWKKTVGPVEERELLVNRWNTEFAHRLTPDYFQSFGLGFFEYFQLAEDLGAAPLPILSCGMACQFNTGELVPMDELDPYVQDALDLIEFANGDVKSPWGKLRADMGHPAPFNLKYIGIGNEQWGPEYIKRYM